MFVRFRWREEEERLREVVQGSASLSEVLRRLGLRAAGGNHATLKRYIELFAIDTSHFRATPIRRGTSQRIPLGQVLVQNSPYDRGQLKRRLFEEGLKTRECEECGQGEIWRGRRMALILDHVNGVHDDNRLENLRIVCPNCAATLDTHCGRKTRLPNFKRPCERCGEPFEVKRPEQRYCSRYCASRHVRRGRPNPGARRVERPPYDQLMEEVKRFGWSGTGRRYGVSDNAIRKWVKWYEREREDRLEEDRRAA